MSRFVPPLHVHVVHHPRHEAGARHAEALVKWLSGDPDSYTALQADLPVFVWTSTVGDEPPTVAWGGAQQDVLVLLAGTAMVASDAWRAWAVEQVKRPLQFIVCADTPHSGNLGAAFSQHQSVRLDFLDESERAAELLLRVTHFLARVIGGPDGKTSLFISHTKKYADVVNKEDDGRAFALSLKSFLDGRPAGVTFFDEVQLSASDDYQAVFERAIEASVIVALHTDRFTSRYWCAWETLEAKLRQRPIVVVDALHDEERQSLSYLGNAHTLRWEPKDRDSVPRRRRIVSAALLELLRVTHDRARLAAARDAFLPSVTHLLPSRPELATLPPGDGILLHPDPPLPANERRLLARHRPGLSILSLTQGLAHAAQTLAGRRIAVSISDGPDRAAHGVGALHQERLWTRFAMHLLLAEAQLAYGGDLRAGGYTEQLFDLVRGAVDDGARLPERRVHCYLGWPVHLTLTEELAAALPAIFAIHRPEGAPRVEGVAPEKFIPPSTMVPSERLAWTLGMTAMRRAMANDCDARVLVGGQLRGVAPIPGLVEELLTFLDLDKPVYLVGGFGGMARVLARALDGERPAELTAAFQDENGARTAIRESIDAAARDGNFGELESGGKKWPALQPVDFAAIVARLNALGPGALGNGLDSDENRRLFVSRDAVEQVGLVLLGLGRRFSGAAPTG